MRPGYRQLLSFGLCLYFEFLLTQSECVSTGPNPLTVSTNNLKVVENADGDLELTGNLNKETLCNDMVVAIYVAVDNVQQSNSFYSFDILEIMQ